jgi:hypothetical protein
MAIPSHHYPYSFVQVSPFSSLLALILSPSQQQSEPEPLSLFAQTQREIDEEFYATFPQAREAMQARVGAQLKHGHDPAANYGYFGESICHGAPSSVSYQHSPHRDSMQVEYPGFQPMAIHPTTPSQNFHFKQSNQPEQLHQSYAPPLESPPDVNTYLQVNQLPSLTQSQHFYPYPCCKPQPLVMDPIVSPPAPAFRQTSSTTTEVHPPFDPTLQYRTIAEPAWSNPPALTVPTRRNCTVQEPTVRVTSGSHPPHVRACHAQHQSDYQTHTPSSHHSLVWRTHRSASPRPLMPLTPLPIKRPAEKKPPLACLFCRGRKIACGPPIPGSKDKTCK